PVVRGQSGPARARLLPQHARPAEPGHQLGRAGVRERRDRHAANDLTLPAGEARESAMERGPSGDGRPGRAGSRQRPGRVPRQHRRERLRRAGSDRLGGHSRRGARRVRRDAAALSGLSARRDALSRRDADGGAGSDASRLPPGRRCPPKGEPDMTAITKENAARILSDLIALPSVNPMGRPFTGTERVERRVADYIENLFAPYGVPMERDPYSAMHENLLVTVPGRTNGPALLFESHMDTVPADDWPDRAFEPRWEGDTLFGRGACDDKGPLVSMILATLAVLESATPPPRPILFLAAGDEEYNQTGILHFRDRNDSLAGGVFGEPTNCLPIVQHKGTIRWDITVHGRSAHTS